MDLRAFSPIILGLALVACQQDADPRPPQASLPDQVATADDAMAQCHAAAQKSNSAQRLAEAVGLCLEKKLPGPFALLLEVQVNEGGARLLAQSGANPLIPASVLDACVEKPIRQWSVPPIAEVLQSNTSLVESMTLELGREQGGDLQVRSRSTCTPPLPGETLHSAMEPLEMAPNCEKPLGSSAQNPGPMLFGLNIVHASSEQGAVCSPVTDGLPSGFITCMCADLLARDAAQAARRSPGGQPSVTKSEGGHTGRRHWVVRRLIAGRPTYHRLEGMLIPSP